ncbi:MAG TPA: Ig-like domain-containing protein, partial [Acidobacteriota bacterium]|nr:Ig-like domain-containing protein [Acidobacteriota bacterium]
MNRSTEKFRGMVAVTAAIALILLLAAADAGAAIVAESLYVNTSVSSVSISAEVECHGAPDGVQASISGKLASGDNWTFDFDSTVNPGRLIDSARIFITHRESGYVNDSLVFEYYAGTAFTIFESFGNVPAVLTTAGPYSVAGLTNASQLNGFQIRLRGVQKIGTGSPDVITYYVDAVHLEVFFEGQTPVLSAIGPQSVDEGQNLNFGISATDPNADSLILSAENVPTNATFTDNYNGTGTFDFNPDLTQSGVYNVTFIASDGILADTEIVAITVNDAAHSPVLSTIGAKAVDEGQNLNFGVSATDPDADSLILTAENIPANATFADNYNGTGTFDFNPDLTQSGVYNVTFIASDGVLADTEVVAITVNDVNRVPTLASIGPRSVDEGQNLNFGVSASDPDADSLILTAENVPANATFTDNYNGTGT